VTIASFVEGATRRKGGLGLVGVPLILKSAAERGHHAVLMIAGHPMPGREKFIVDDVQSALKRSEGAGTFGIVTVRAGTTWAFAPALVWRAWRLVRRADVVSLHSLYSFPVLAGFLMARFHGKPYGLWPHGVLAPFQRSISKRRKWLYDRLFARRILDGASVLFYSAEGEFREAAELGLRSPAVVVPHGIDVTQFADLPPRGCFRSRVFPGHEGELIVFLARLNAKKGLDLLIAAMAAVLAERPRARLAIVGPPDPAAFERRVRTWIREHGIESQVALTGPVNDEAKREVMADADVFVLPSQAENFGFSVFEAMASGVPVVVSDTLNYAAEIARCGAGLAVPREAASFATSIVGLLGNADLRKEMGGNGIRLARKYSWDETGARVERAFESILHGCPIPQDLLRKA
jgi:glycosyltransferase involved in cell wall biosynthesis